MPDVVGKTPGDAEKTLRDAGLTLGQATPQPRRSRRRRSRARSPPRRRSSRRASRSTSSWPCRSPRARRRRRGRRGRRRRRRRGARTAEAGRGRRWRRGRSVKVPQIAGAGPRRLRAEGRRPRASCRDREGVRRGRQGHACSRSSRSPAPRSQPGHRGQALRLRRLPRSSPTTTTRTCCSSTARDGHKLDPIAKGSQDEQRPGLERRRQRDRLHLATARSSCATSPTRTRSPIPLTKEGETFSDLAWAPTADVNTLALIKAGTGDQLADAQSVALLRRDRRPGHEHDAASRCPRTCIGRKINWAPDGKSLLAFAASSATAREFGMVRVHDREAVLGQPGRLGRQGLRDRHVEAGRGRARRRDLARRQAARRGRPARQERAARAVFDEAGRLRCSPTRRRSTCRACKAIWRPDGLRARRRARRRLLRDATGELVRLPVADPKAQTSLELNGDNPVFQPLAVE